MPSAPMLLTTKLSYLCSFICKTRNKNSYLSNVKLKLNEVPIDEAPIFAHNSA